MAYTSSQLVQSVFGNQRVKLLRITADAASGAVDTNFGVIDFVQPGVQCAATVGFRTFMNTNSGLTALNGTIAISGAADGDVIYMTVYGH